VNQALEQRPLPILFYFFLRNKNKEVPHPLPCLSDIEIQSQYRLAFK